MNETNAIALTGLPPPAGAPSGGRLPLYRWWAWYIQMGGLLIPATWNRACGWPAEAVSGQIDRLLSKRAPGRNGPRG